MLLGTALAADPVAALMTATGTVDKVGKGSLTIRPRGPEGRFTRSLTLKLTGTSKLAAVTVEKRAGRAVPVQRDIDAQDLQPNQSIAIIYVAGPGGPVLLAAVVQPAGGS